MSHTCSCTLFAATATLYTPSFEGLGFLSERLLNLDGFWHENIFSTDKLRVFGANKTYEQFPHIYTEGFHLCLRFSLQIHIQCVSLYAMQNHGNITVKPHFIVCVMSFSKLPADLVTVSKCAGRFTPPPFLPTDLVTGKLLADYPPLSAGRFGEGKSADRITRKTFLRARVTILFLRRCEFDDRHLQLTCTV